MNVQYLERPGLPRLAYVHSPAPKNGKQYPMVMFLGGYRSDMNGTKATYFEKQCRARGQGYLRFDYSGHGMSGGDFSQGTIGSWKRDALAMLDHVTQDSVIVVGSSMGGWIGLLVALERSGTVRGFVGIAAAPDFTEDIFMRMSPEQKQEFRDTGKIPMPGYYGDPAYPYTKEFHEEARRHLLLNRPHEVDFPIRLVQGMRDEDVAWETAIEIQKAFRGEEADILFIEDGDHRLSRPEDLELLDKEIRSVSDYY